LADERPGGEATEAATPHKKQEAKRKGNRLNARELGTAMVGLAGALWGWVMIIPLGTALGEATVRAFQFDAGTLAQFDAAALAGALLAPLLLPMLALLGAVLVAVIAGQALSGGIGFSAEALLPKWERLSPAKGLTRMFGSKGLVELVKALVKAGLIVSISILLLRDALPQLMQLSAGTLDAALGSIAALAARLLLFLTLGLVLVAGADLPWQIFQWLKQLRMNRQELRDEHKQQEGSPEMKQAMRRAARQMLKSANRGAMADATVVLTNPTHFAVALRYRPDVDAAPVILMRGRGLMAEVIRELAAEQQVLLLSYPSVARAIYYTGKAGMTIRPDLYAAVAVIIAWVLRMQEGDHAPPAVEAPAGARFDEMGRPED